MDLNRPLGGRLGLVLVVGVALAGLAQGLGSILWNDFALPPTPAPAAQEVNPLLREAPTAPKAEAPAATAEAANAATAEANKTIEPEPEPEPTPVPKIEVTPAAPTTANGSPLPPYGAAGNITSAPAPVAPVQAAPPASPEPEDQPPM